jgi:hypothetical protein
MLLSEPNPDCDMAIPNIYILKNNWISPYTKNEKKKKKKKPWVASGWFESYMVDRSID